MYILVENINLPEKLNSCIPDRCVAAWKQAKSNF